MIQQSIFSRRVLIGLTTAALVTFLASLFFMTREESNERGHDAVGPSTFSISAIGHAGFAAILSNLGIPVVKSQYASSEKLGPGSVLVIAEPLPSLLSFESFRPLLDAKTVLLVLPKRAGSASEKRPDWLGKTEVLPDTVAKAILDFAVAKGEITRPETADDWTKNALGPRPNVSSPVQLMQSDMLRPIVATGAGILVGAVESHGHRLWVLSDPDIIANHGIAQGGNAEFAVSLIDRLLGDGGRVVFDETVHGFVAQPASPLKLLFTFPYVFATVQGVIAIALLLWATIARFGVPEPVPAPLRAGKLGLIENAAKLLEFAGHQKVIVRRYVEATIREVANQIHAPSELSEQPLLEWLRRVGESRAVGSDCMQIYRQAGEQAAAARTDPEALVSIVRDIHRWKKEMLDGTARNSRQR
jgi:uncharacterized protein DUF4350